jgi:hypothetical protein
VAGAHEENLLTSIHSLFTGADPQLPGLFSLPGGGWIFKSAVVGRAFSENVKFAHCCFDKRLQL